MAVKTLDQATKSAIVALYQNGARSITQLATTNQVSRSTIRRILNESGEFTPEQGKRISGDLAAKLLERYSLTLSQATDLMSQAYDLDIIKNIEGKIVINFEQFVMRRPKLLSILMDLEEGTWQTLLNEVITNRVAKAANVHVQTRMLQLEEKVKANERDNKDGD